MQPTNTEVYVSAAPPSMPAYSQNARYTFSSSFSFSIPETWRPKGGIVRWINELPGPQAREQPLEPTSTISQKHQVDITNEKVSDPVFARQNERTRRVSLAPSTARSPPPASPTRWDQRRGLLARGHRAVVESIANILYPVDSHSPALEPRHHYVRSDTPASDYTVVYQHHHGEQYQDQHHQRYTKDNASSRRASTITGTTARNSMISNSPPGTPLTVPGRARMRFAFVGDSGCGKSSLLLRYYRDTFTEAYTPTQYELFTKTATLPGGGDNDSSSQEAVDLELWDMSGDIQLHQLQLLSYLHWDAVFLCFSVNSQKQFDRTQTQWLREIRMNCRDAPVILLGLKKDLRFALGAWQPLCSASLAAAAIPGARVGTTEACLAAHIHGAVRYMECSAKTGEGVDEVLNEGVRIVFDERAADEEATRMNMQAVPPNVTRRLGSGLGRLFCFA